jgi:hypothetical protein
MEVPFNSTFAPIILSELPFSETVPEIVNCAQLAKEIAHNNKVKMVFFMSVQLFNRTKSTNEKMIAWKLPTGKFLLH